MGENRHGNLGTYSRDRDGDDPLLRCTVVRRCCGELRAHPRSSIKSSLHRLGDGVSGSPPLPSISSGYRPTHASRSLARMYPQSLALSSDASPGPARFIRSSCSTGGGPPSPPAGVSVHEHSSTRSRPHSSPPRSSEPRTLTCEREERGMARAWARAWAHGEGERGRRARGQAGEGAESCSCPRFG